MGYFFKPLLLLLLLVLPLQAVAQDQPQLSQQDYKLLKTAFDLLEKGQLSQAYQQLSVAAGKVKSDYAKALAQYNLGNIELQRERYQKALKHLTQAYQSGQLAVDPQTNLIHTLAQLNCMEEKWQACINYLKPWMQQVPSGKVKATDYLLLAQAYSQLKKWQSVIRPISVAIASRQVPPENWYQLKIAAHIQLKQWHAVIKEQKHMLRHYAKRAGNWRQLVAMQLQIKASKAALATQRMGFERGILRQAKDYRLLAQMMLQAEIPYFAGKVIEQGMQRGVLKHNKTNLQLLSHCWIQARENKKAVTVLTSLNKIAPSQQSLTQLAHMQIELQDWRAANKTLHRALKRHKGKSKNLQLLLGVTQIKLKQYVNARNSFMTAASDIKLKQSVKGWMNYLQRIADNDLELIVES